MRIARLLNRTDLIGWNVRPLFLKNREIRFIPLSELLQRHRFCCCYRSYLITRRNTPLTTWWDQTHAIQVCGFLVDLTITTADCVLTSIKISSSKFSTFVSFRFCKCNGNDLHTCVLAIYMTGAENDERQTNELLHQAKTVIERAATSFQSQYTNCPNLWNQFFSSSPLRALLLRLAPAVCKVKHQSIDNFGQTILFSLF